MGIHCNVACSSILSRAGGVGLQAATRYGARDPLVRSQVDKTNLITLPKNFKKKNGPYTGPVLLRQGEPGTSQYICNNPNYFQSILKPGD